MQMHNQLLLHLVNPLQLVSKSIQNIIQVFKIYNAQKIAIAGFTENPIPPEYSYMR